MNRVALAVVRAGVRVLPPPEHLDVVDNPVADGRKRRDRRGVHALPEAVPVLVDALRRMTYVLRINWRQDAAARLEPTWIPCGGWSYRSPRGSSARPSGDSSGTTRGRPCPARATASWAPATAATAARSVRRIIRLVGPPKCNYSVDSRRAAWRCAAAASLGRSKFLESGSVMSEWSYVSCLS